MGYTQVFGRCILKPPTTYIRLWLDRRSRIVVVVVDSYGYNSKVTSHYTMCNKSILKRRVLAVGQSNVSLQEAQSSFSFTELVH